MKSMFSTKEALRPPAPAGPGRSRVLNLLPQTLALLFLAQVAPCLLLIANLIPPFQGPDEFNHMKRAEQIASGQWLATRYDGPQTSGGKVDRGIDQVDAIIRAVRFHPEMKVSRAMLDQAAQIRWGERARLTFANTAIYAPFLYLPAATAIRAAKIAGASISRSLVLARLSTGLTSAAVAAAAIAISGEAAPLLLVLLSLPMSLSLFAAVSQDGPMLAAAALAAALALRLSKKSGPPPRAELSGLCIALALLVLGRPAYAPLALVLLLLPMTLRARLFCVCSVLFPTAIWSLLTAKLTIINTEAHRGVHPFEQLAGLALHPARLLGLAWHAATDRQGMEGLPFRDEFIGVLGWQDVVLPGWFYGLAGWALAFGILACSAKQRRWFSWRGRYALAALILASAASVFLLEYLTWTPVGFPWIEGVQGRYFLPIAFFVPCVLPAMRSRWLVRLAGPATLLLLAFPAVSASVTIASIVSRYYIR